MAQVEIDTKDPIFKVALSRTSQTTRGYDHNRIVKISHIEQPSGTTVELVLQNYDGALTSLDFEHYQAVISLGYDTKATRTAWVAGTVYAVDDIVRPTTVNGYQYRCSVAGTSHAATEPTWGTALGVTQTDNTVTWEMDGTSGYEYSRTAPLRVRVQELHSGRGLLKVILRPIGIEDQLAEDKAESALTLTADDARTIKTLITAIAGATLAPYTNYTAYTVTYDSEDSLIDTLKPRDFFSIQVNDNRLDKIQELLRLTGCKMRVENDGQIHIFDPVTTGTTYDYEYKFNVSGSHEFFSKTIRLRSVNPNQEIVKSHPDQGVYTGSSTSATSYALAPKTHTTFARLASDSQATSIAGAIIEGYELDSERGFAVVPMNVGQELWDYVKVTDSRENDTKVGNIQYIQRDVELHFDDLPLTWSMMIAFGKVSAQSIAANMLTAGLGAEGGNPETLSKLSLNELARRIEATLDLIDSLTNKLNEVIVAQNELRTFIIDTLLKDELVVKKLTVTEQLIIPTWV